MCFVSLLDEVGMARRATYFVGPWDLHLDLACVPSSPDLGRVVLVESVAKGRALPYHRKKLVLVLSALHHFAQTLRERGYEVDVINAPTYVEGIRRRVEAHGSSEVIAMLPREWGLQEALLEADREGTFGVPLTLHDDGGPGGHFLLPREAFADWARGRKVLRMDTFYRWMRKRTGWLMEGKKPVGGKWSYDSDNRKRPPKDLRPPSPHAYVPDAITAEVMSRVARWPDHWGSVDGFDWPVTHAEAREELSRFIEHRAARFGDFQDAMLTGEPFMWHARLSSSLNLGLISPGEVVEAVLEAYASGAMPLNAAEGFIRQVIGWREFIRGVYWWRMPEMREANLLGATRALPNFFWAPEQTDMHCMRESITAVRDHGYAHHIQRLMVLGNFALLAGVKPIEISHWFWAGFVDAFEWVELPNVHGMAVYADDTFTTKPYAASASYISKMSNYCGACPYNPKARTGDDACPFNSMFWRFMAQHRERLSTNPRMNVLYRTWDRWSAEQRQEISEQAERFLNQLDPADHAWSFDDDGC